MSTKLVRQVETLLLDQLRDLPPQTPLPPEPQLAIKLGISRQTLRKSLANLEAKELIRRVKRKGTFPTRGHQAIPIYQQRARLIGIVSSHAFSKHYPQGLSEGVYKVATHHGYNLVIAGRETRENIYQILDNPYVVGLLLYSITDQDFIGRLAERGKPICIIDHHSECDRIDSIQVDSAKGIILAVQHLYQLGHRKIAFINSNLHSLNPARLQGYETAMRQLKVYLKPEWIVEKPPTFEGGVAGVSELLALPPTKLPTAIIGFSTKVASGALRSILKRGLRVPEDISIVGGGGSMDAKWAKALPPITLLNLSPQELGKAAMSHLLDRIKRPHFPAQNALISPQLENKGSTGKI